MSQQHGTRDMPTYQCRGVRDWMAQWKVTGDACKHIVSASHQAKEADAGTFGLIKVPGNKGGGELEGAACCSSHHTPRHKPAGDSLSYHSSTASDMQHSRAAYFVPVVLLCIKVCVGEVTCQTCTIIISASQSC
jgi:hypothetical protein